MTTDGRLDAIIDCLIACARHDFSVRIPISDSLDDVDAMATGINIMAEDLERSVASRAELESAYNALRDAQQAAMRSAKLAAIGQLASGVAHEVNNPAGWATAAVAIGRRRALEIESVLEGLGLLERSDLRSALDELRDAHDRALEGLLRIREVAGELSATFARSSAMALEPLLIDDVVRSTCNLVRPTLRPGVTMSISLGDVPPVRASRGRLAQVVTNLVVNALNALEGLEEQGDATVALETSTDGDWALLVVDDSGPGPLCQRA